MIIILSLTLALFVVSALLLVLSKKWKQLVISQTDLRAKFLNLKISYNESKEDIERVKGERNIAQQSLEALTIEHEELKSTYNKVVEALKQYGWAGPKRGIQVIIKPSSPSQD